MAFYSHKVIIDQVILHIQLINRPNAALLVWEMFKDFLMSLSGSMAKEMYFIEWWRQNNPQKALLLCRYSEEISHIELKFKYFALIASTCFNAICYMHI